MFELPSLPYQRNALEPHITEETLNYHYGKHHRTYVDTLNKLIKGTDLEGENLDEIVRTATGNIYNQAAQHWNHSFYWLCMSPESAGSPTGELYKAIEKSFGSYNNFVTNFTDITVDIFGSGWGWLVADSKGDLLILGTQNAGNPITEGYKPLLTCDVWEHAYYIDYRNERAKYIKSFFELVDWKFVETNYAKAVSSTEKHTA